MAAHATPPAIVQPADVQPAEGTGPNIVQLTEIDLTLGNRPYRLPAKTLCRVDGLNSIRVVRSLPSNTARIIVQCDGPSSIDNIIDDTPPGPVATVAPKKK
jgi:hypothetical protein